MPQWQKDYPALKIALDGECTDAFFQALDDYGIHGHEEITGMFDTEMYSEKLLEMIFCMSGAGTKTACGLESFHDFFLRSFDQGNVQSYETCGTWFFGIAI